MALALLAALSGCEPGGGARLGPTRGYIFISIDTLRADHLGCYGYSRDTSPFLDGLAASGRIFDNAYVQLPGTLPSHMSMFTGLYPGEHGVLPPDGVLAEQIPTLPEIFRAAGYRTAGHTEGGYMHGGFGFARGFEEFDHDSYKVETDVERTFGRGLDFLKGLRSDEKFFLFLHTYAIHDPYPDDRLYEDLNNVPGNPLPKMQRYNTLFWSEQRPTDAIVPTGPELSRLNQEGRQASAETLDYYRALYDAQIRYLDDVLRDFFGQLEASGMLAETTVVLTSDHGEEFAEHGKLLHTQLYRETLRVPLIVLHPDFVEGGRVEDIVQSIDLAPTLYELADIDPPEPMSGVSLVPHLEGREVEGLGRAYAETPGGIERTLLQQTDNGIYQLVWQAQQPQEGGFWMSREISFDTFSETLELEVESFREPRFLEVFVDGVRHEKARLQPANSPNDEATGLQVPSDPKTLVVELAGSGKKRITLKAASCESPYELGLSDDRRCLSIRVASRRPWLAELFHNDQDPSQATDLSPIRGEKATRMLRTLNQYRFEPVATGTTRDLDAELQDRLKSLGYLP